MNFKIGDLVSFVGRFGMHRYVTRKGTIVEILKFDRVLVDCPQGKHTVDISQLRKL